MHYIRLAKSKKLIIFLVLISISLHSKSLLKETGLDDIAKLKLDLNKGQYQKPKLKALGKNYFNLYNMGFKHYDKYNKLPSYATFYIFNLETKQKEIIKLPLKNFINTNKKLFLEQNFLKEDKTIKYNIEILYYSKKESAYLLTADKKDTKSNIDHYSSIYLHWRHKSNVIWGYDLNQFDTRNKVKIINYDSKNKKIYFYTACRFNNPKINLLNLNTRTKTINFMINHKINSRQKEKNLAIKSVYPFDNYNKFLFLEYSENKDRQAKGYLIYKKSNIPRTQGYKVKSFNIPLEAYIFDISKDSKSLLIASSKENILISYDLKSLKEINRVKIEPKLRYMKNKLLYKNKKSEIER